MNQLEGWGFISLMSCLVAITLSLTLLSGTWQVGGCIIAVVLGILSGGLYAASVRTCDPAASQSKEASRSAGP